MKNYGGELTWESYTSHVYGDWVTDKEASCTEGGSKYKECACGDIVIEEIPVVDHEWNEEFTVDKEPTCTEECSKLIHCVNCGAIKDGEVIPKFDHIWNKRKYHERTVCCHDVSLRRIYGL